MSFQLTTTGSSAFLGSFSVHMAYCGLFDENNVELSHIEYERQSITWEIDPDTNELALVKVSGENYVARFNVTAGTVKYIGFFNSSAELIGKIDLKDDAITYTEPDLFDIIDLSLEHLLELIEG